MISSLRDLIMKFG